MPRFWQNDCLVRLSSPLAFTVLLVACESAEKPEFDTDPGTKYEHIRDIQPPVDASGYEIAPILKPEQVLPPEMVQGDHHTVVGDVKTSGFTNEYQVQSGFGFYTVEGTGLLRKRIHEIDVMAALRDYEVSNEEVYALAAANAAEGPVEGAAQLITNPVATISGIPEGVGTYAQTIGEMRKGQRTYLEDSYAEELIGFSTAKREWAYRLGVDPYSANPNLQRTLNRYGWLSFAGGMTVRLPMMAVSGPAGMALSVVQMADDAKRMLRDQPPEQIRLRSREKLLAMGLSEDLAERVVGHPICSPTQLLAAVEAMDALENAKGREKFFETLVIVDSPKDCYIAARLAVLLLLYHNNVSPIVEVMAPEGLIQASAANGDLVVPLYIDYVVWSPQAEKFFDLTESSLPEGGSINRKVFFVSGNLSPRAKQEIAEKGWEIMDEIEQKALKAYDEKRTEPGKADPTRVIPEIGS